jgi:lambda family phage portal protein
MAPVTSNRDDIKRAWTRAAGIALDIVQNSGKIRGAVDQVIADTVGVELFLSPNPDLTGLGYSDAERAEFIKLIKLRWKQWAWNKRECDSRGKFTVPQMVDIALRHELIYGESTGVLTYMTPEQRKRYGITTGTKVCMLPPHRLTQETNEAEGLYQGVMHDVNGRPVAYRFLERESGISVPRTWQAYDTAGRPVVMHVFDPMDAEDVRGISRMASAFRTHLQHELAADATLQTFILQTLFAATITSELPSAEAFEAIEEFKDDGGNATLYNDFMGLVSAQMETAKESQFRYGGDNPQINHLAPGESFAMHTAATPGSQWLPFSASLNRDMARAIGVTYGGLTMDHTGSTYSSVRMENASIWPVVMRRRERVAGPMLDMIYQGWLDEEIGEQRIAFKGGYRAFAANRQRVTWTQWRGPAKPSADDGKSAKASSERIVNGTGTLENEVSEYGMDPEEVRETRLAEHNWYKERGMVSPYERTFNLPQEPDAPASETKPQ